MFGEAGADGHGDVRAAAASKISGRPIGPRMAAFPVSRLTAARLKTAHRGREGNVCYSRAETRKQTDCFPPRSDYDTANYRLRWRQRGERVEH